MALYWETMHGEPKVMGNGFETIGAWRGLPGYMQPTTIEQQRYIQDWVMSLQPYGSAEQYIIQNGGIGERGEDLVVSGRPSPSLTSDFWKLWEQGIDVLSLPFAPWRAIPFWTQAAEKGAEEAWKQTGLPELPKDLLDQPASLFGMGIIGLALIAAIVLMVKW